jgi:hypothetical protein
MIHCLSFSLSFFHILHYDLQKCPCILSFKMGTALSIFGKIDTFESIHWYSYPFFILIINGKKKSLFMVQLFYLWQQWKCLYERESLCWNSHCFGQGVERKYYGLVRILRHYYEYVCSLKKGMDISSQIMLLKHLKM